MENQEVPVAGNRTLIKLAAGNQEHAMKEHLSSQLNLDTQRLLKKMPVALLGGFILFENIPEQPLMQPARGFSVVIPVWKKLNTPFKDPCCEMPQLEFKAALSQTKRPYYLMVTHGEVRDCCLTKFQEACYTVVISLTASCCTLHPDPLTPWGISSSYQPNVCTMLCTLAWYQT